MYRRFNQKKTLKYCTQLLKGLFLFVPCVTFSSRAIMENAFTIGRIMWAVLFAVAIHLNTGESGFVYQGVYLWSNSIHIPLFHTSFNVPSTKQGLKCVQADCMEGDSYKYYMKCILTYYCNFFLYFLPLSISSDFHYYRYIYFSREETKRMYSQYMYRLWSILSTLNHILTQQVFPA